MSNQTIKPDLPSIADYQHIFFIGIAGTGMSALAQYMAGVGKQVNGSDRYFDGNEADDIKLKLQAAGIQCFLQDGSGIHSETDLVVVSTAIEDTVPEVIKAKELNIPILKRSEVLAMIARSKKTIAVGGTSGKSTTSAMLYDILLYAGLEPGIISGAGLVSIIETGKIGNAAVGKGEWLIIEADESDGSIVQYTPEIGLLLNVDKDHQEIEVLQTIFNQFKENTKGLFIVNRSNELSAGFSANQSFDFSIETSRPAGYMGTHFHQKGMHIEFDINGFPFELETVGRHNMENALAAAAVANQLGVSLAVCASALKGYKGIYRRHQLLGKKNGVLFIDDYAHNPVKCAASIEACQMLAPKVIAWFQPHGYGPTRFLKQDFIQEFISVLRPEDEIWMSEIFYAGGTAVKDISSKDLTDEIGAAGKRAFFVENRDQLRDALQSSVTEDCVILLMGARDPSLEKFTHQFYQTF